MNGKAVARGLGGYLLSNPNAMKACEAVLADLAEYEGVLERARAIGAKWHSSVDF